jgi:hypothetical protein
LEPDIIQLLAIESTSNEEASNYVANALNNSFKTTIPIVAVESIVAPDPYTNNDGTTATYLADNTNSVNRFTLS